MTGPADPDGPTINVIMIGAALAAAVSGAWLTLSTLWTILARCTRSPRA
jgi:hypothetical protein